MLRLLWISVAIIALDQATKFWANSTLVFHVPLEITPFFNINLAYNTGAAFSFLDSAGGWQRWMFVLLAVGVSIFLAQWLRRTRPQERWQAYGLVSIIGGALGNAVDRLIHGHVVDFIQFHYAGYAFPTFNVADIAIFCGAVLLIFESFRAEQAGKTES